MAGPSARRQLRSQPRAPRARQQAVRRTAQHSQGRGGVVTLVSVSVLALAAVLLIGAHAFAPSGLATTAAALVAAPTATGLAVGNTNGAMSGGNDPAQVPTAGPQSAAAGVSPTAGPDDGPTMTATAGPVTLSRVWSESDPRVQFDPQLAGALDQAMSGVDGQVSLYVKDLGSGRGALLNPDAELPSASLFKLYVLYSVFQAKLPFDEELTITPTIKSYDLGTLELNVGEQLSVAEALERMVTISDNASAILLADTAGGGRITANLADLGMSQTHYQEDRLTTSTADMATLLELIARGQAVSPSASADMLHLLLRQKVNDRLPRLLPANAQVAHKTGNLDGIVNDVGIIYGPNSSVLVAAMVSGTSDESAAATGIAQAAQVAYQYFESLPAQPARPTIPPAPNRPIPPTWRGPGPPVVEFPTETPLVAATPADEAAAEPTRGAAPSPRATEPATPAAVSDEAPAATAEVVATHAPAPTVAPPATAVPTPRPTERPAATPVRAPTQAATPVPHPTVRPVAAPSR